MTAAHSTRRWPLFTAILLLVAVLAGPRTCVREPDMAAVQAGVPRDLAALPAWLTQREEKAGVLDTAVAKRVRYANPAAPARTPWSVVYLHGFSATRQETAPVSELVAQALGANLFETRLKGHGLPGDSLGAVSAQDWLNDAVEAMEIGRRLGDSVLVVGTSTGGTLGVWLATLPPDARKGLATLALVSPNFGPKDAKAGLLTLPWANVILPRVIPQREWTARNDEQRRFWTVKYPSSALFPMQALVEHVRVRSLEGYNVPTLVFYHEGDQVVDAARTKAWLESLAKTSRAPLNRIAVVPADGEDGHVIAGRIVSPSQTAMVRDRIVAFVRPR